MVTLQKNNNNNNNRDEEEVLSVLEHVQIVLIELYVQIVGYE